MAGLSKLTLRLVLAQLFAFAFVCASPLNSPDDLAGIVARGLRPAGTQCSQDSQCISDRCVTDGWYPNGTMIPFTCHRQQPGGHCAGNANCQTRSCNKTSNTCEFSSLGQICYEFTDCYGWLDQSQTCSSGRCKYFQGISGCKKNSSCVTNFCSKGACRSLPQAPNAPCSIDSECLSNSCADIPYNMCTNPDGTFSSTNCPGILKNCDRYLNGHTCANNGECKNGLCKSGVCTAGQDGDACVEQYQCSGVCGSNGICSTPSNGSLYPNDACQSNNQCNSGRCTTAQQQKDSYGVNNVILQNQSPPRCDYLDNGQQGCRSYKDCQTGLCQSGTCQLGEDGDRCQVNYNCKNLCGLDGKCYSPSGAQPRSQPCKTDDQCLSNYCKFGYSSVGRPYLDSDDPDFLISVDDTSCGASALAGACSVDQDCGQGVCNSENICALLPIGSTCSSSSQCITHECYFVPGDYEAGGTCQLASPYTACKRDDQCLSNSCVEQYCRTRRDDGDDPNPYGYDYFGQCSPVACAASGLNGACRVDLDCGYNGQLGCSVNKTCKKTNGQTCSASSECLDGACSQGSCVDPATLTTSTTSTTTATSTSTTSTTSTTTSTTTTTTTTTTTKTKTTKKPTTTKTTTSKTTKSSTTKSKSSATSSSTPSTA